MSRRESARLGCRVEPLHRQGRAREAEARLGVGDEGGQNPKGLHLDRYLGWSPFPRIRNEVYIKGPTVLKRERDRERSTTTREGGRAGKEGKKKRGRKRWGGRVEGLHSRL